MSREIIISNIAYVSITCYYWKYIIIIIIVLNIEIQKKKLLNILYEN